MFIVFISYKVDLSVVDNFVSEHIDFLNAHYAKGHWGPKCLEQEV
jgi:uncharacterized protein YciI